MKTILLLLSPFAPHIAEEIWELQKFGETISEQCWPAYEEEKCTAQEVEILVQVNGKGKARLLLPTNLSQEEALSLAKAEPAVAGLLQGKTLVKELYVPGRLINLVVR